MSLGVLEMLTNVKGEVSARDIWLASKCQRQGRLFLSSSEYIKLLHYAWYLMLLYARRVEIIIIWKGHGIVDLLDR